jgi:hypothetical protein
VVDASPAGPTPFAGVADREAIVDAAVVTAGLMPLAGVALRLAAVLDASLAASFLAPTPVAGVAVRAAAVVAASLVGAPTPFEGVALRNGVAPLPLVGFTALAAPALAAPR